MGSEADSEQNHTPPKLSLAISRPSKPLEPSELPTPPPKSAVSIPFKWEEAPGKPRPCHTESEAEAETESAAFRTLELPPRLLFLEAKVSNLPFPTTVLEGPYVGRAISFTTSHRSPRGLGNGNFGSSRWSSFEKNSGDVEGNFDSPGSTVDSRMNDGITKAKITRVKRRGSFFSTSHTRTHMWASVYESLKQVVPWRRKQEKQRNGLSNLT